MRLVVVAFAMVLGALAGCSGSNGTADGGLTGDATVEGDGGVGTGDSGVVPDGGSDGACPPLPTEEELLKIEQDVRAALAFEAEPLAGCNSDADCMNAEIRADCIKGCCVPINKENEGEYRYQEQKIAARYCTPHVDGCPVPEINGECDCTRAQCLDGKCVNPATPGVHRVPLDGTEGFCASYGYANASCQTVEDCVAYRVPVDANCCTGVIEESDCAIVNRYGIAPDQPTWPATRTPATASAASASSPSRPARAPNRQSA